MTATPIAELTPEQFNARFPVGTRVATKRDEHETVRPATIGLVTGQAFAGTHQALYLREVRPIVTLGSLNVGDEFRWHDETPSAGVYRVEDRGVRGDCGVIVSPLGAFSSILDFVHPPSALVQVVALNLAQDDRPEVFPGTMLREGDVVEMVDSVCHLTPTRAAVERYNARVAPLSFRNGKLIDRDGGIVPTQHEQYSWRLVPATSPALAPTEPCPAPVEETPEHTDEQLAAVAAVRELDKPRKCSQCKAPENKYRHLMPNFKNVLFCSECAWLGDNNGTFLPTKPPRKLSPAVAYHLNDDCDASGIPEWN